MINLSDEADVVAEEMVESKSFLLDSDSLGNDSDLNSGVVLSKGDNGGKAVTGSENASVHDMTSEASLSTKKPRHSPNGGLLRGHPKSYGTHRVQ